MYMLKEQDRSRWAGMPIGNSLKKFHLHQRLHLDHTPDFSQKSLLILEGFLAADGNNL